MTSPDDGGNGGAEDGSGEEQSPDEPKPAVVPFESADGSSDDGSGPVTDDDDVRADDGSGPVTDDDHGGPADSDDGAPADSDDGGPADSDGGSLAGDRRDRRVAALAYLLGPLTAVGALAVARDAPVVRFHAVQSVGFIAVVALGALALSLLQFLLVFVPLIGNGLSIGFSFVWPLVAVLVIRAWLRLGQAALDGRRLHYPVAGRLAERVA